MSLCHHDIQHIQERVARIDALSREIFDVPNLLPDLGTMKKIDKMAREIHEHCQSIQSLVSQDSGWNDP